MSQPVNVICVLTDDQGVWAAGCYGNPEIRTPNIDRLAQTGTRFANFFVATPVCSPSRATLLTGRIPSQHGVHDWLTRPVSCGPQAVRFLEGEVAYTDILARHGWTCGLCGKWHLGDSQIPQHGFTDWYAHQYGGGDYNKPEMVRHGQRIVEDRYVTDLITEEAVRLLDRYADGGYPFYLSVHYTAPHSPWDGHPQAIVDSYDDCPFTSCPQEPRHPDALSFTDQYLGNREALKGYFAAVTAMDIGLGRIIDRVEALGLRENTLIIFLSDNGFSCGHHGFWGKGNATNPRNMYENSIRVPFVVSRPGSVPAGRVEEAMVSAYDLMPTLLDYLHLAIPTDRNLPGTSFAPALAGRNIPGREDVVIYDEYGPVRMIRTRDWKYVYRHSAGPHQLFHLAADPDERHNLIDDPNQQERIEELKTRMNAWFARYVNPRRDGLAQDGVVHGQAKYLER